MSVNQDGEHRVAPTAGDLSAKQYRCVVRGSGGTIAVAGAGVLIDGILEDTPGLNATTPTGKSGTYRVAGRQKCIAGAAITRGAHVKSDTNGAVVTASTADIAIGKALETASGAGSIISVELHLPGYSAP